MKEIGSYDAKTHLSSILDLVMQGQEFTITKRGKPIAVLSPYRQQGHISIQKALDGLEKLRKKIGRTGLSLKDIKNMKELGRK